MNNIALFITIAAIVAVCYNNRVIMSNMSVPFIQNIHSVIANESGFVEQENQSPESFVKDGKEQFDEYYCADIVLTINQRIKRMINDKIWFDEEYSIFEFLTNSVFEYDIYEGRGNVLYDIIPINPIVNEYGSLYYIELYSIVYEYYGVAYNNPAAMDEIMQNNKKIGRGMVDFGIISKPNYDITNEEMMETCDRIKECFENSLGKAGCSLISISRYYAGSSGTIILYNDSKNKQFYCYADINGFRTYKPTPVTEIETNYVNRLLEVSYIIDD